MRPDVRLLLLVLSAAPAPAAGSSGLRLAGRRGRAAHLAAAAQGRGRGSYDQVAFCEFGPRDGFGSKVQVFVTADNQRYLTFGTDDVGTQTQIACQGPAPGACLGARAGSSKDVRSCEGLQCPCNPATSGEPPFRYMVKMLQEVTPLCSAPTSATSGAADAPDSSGGFRLLMVGLGGGALPGYVLSHCPNGTRVESIEYDPRVIDAATDFFGLKLADGVNEVHQGDGLAAVKERASRGSRYNVVMVDCFGTGGSVPPNCRGGEFAGGVRSLLAPGGRAIQQVWAPQYQELMKDYQKVFGAQHVRGVDVQLGVNFLVVAEAPTSGAAPA